MFSPTLVRPKRPSVKARATDPAAAEGGDLSAEDAEDRDETETHADTQDDESADEGAEIIETQGELVLEEDDVEIHDPDIEPTEDHADAVHTTSLTRRDPLSAYLREVHRHKMLTAEEERTLTEQYSKTQDSTAARKLIEANLRLVVKIAYEYRRAHKNLLDLVQEGNIGLMQAVKRYDPYRGVKLSSYAAWWIRAYMLRFILNNWRLVKLGTTQAQRKLFYNLNKEKARLAAQGIDPTPELIANHLNVETRDVIDMDRRLGSGEASLDAPVGDAEGCFGRSPRDGRDGKRKARGIPRVAQRQGRGDLRSTNGRG